MLTVHDSKQKVVTLQTKELFSWLVFSVQTDCLVWKIRFAAIWRRISRWSGSVSKPPCLTKDI